MRTLFGYLVLIASALLFYFPAAMLDVKQNNLHPNRMQIKRKYNIGMGITFVFVMLAVIYVISQESRFGEKSFLLLVPFISIIYLFEGIFAITIGVYPLHVIKRVILFWNNDVRSMKRVASWQMGLAVVLSITSLILYSA